MKIEHYKQFDRIFPKIRLSYSLYHKWIKNDWVGVFDYLTRCERRSSKAQETGKQGHSYLQLNPPKEIRDVVGEGAGQCEQKIVLNMPDYDLVGQIDWNINNHVVDYKFGSRNNHELQLENYLFMIYELEGVKKRGLLVQCEPIWNDKTLVGAKVLHKHEYRYNKPMIEEWKLILDEMANTIKYQITNGRFEDYLKQYYF